MSDDILADRKRRGARAKAIIDVELVAQAFRGARAKFLDEFERSAPDQQAMRDGAWAKLQALAAVKAEFRGMVSDGRLAEAEIKRLQQGQSGRTKAK